MDNNIFNFGVVEDINDPEKHGRVKVRIFGVHNSNKNILPTEDLPWCITIKSLDSACVSGIGTSPTGLIPGSWCIVTFADPYSKQIPIILGTISGVPSEVIEYDEVLNDSRKIKSDNNKGFVDPEKKYPLYTDESDINRLSRNENIDKTIVQTKKDNLLKDIPMANGDDKWNEPEVPYNAKYPYNKVTETIGGHIIEYDDTPNSERIHTYHKSGSFNEIHPDGSKVTKIVKDNYTLILNDDHLFIQGNVKVYINGDANMYVVGNVSTQIDGNLETQVKGNINTYVEGNYNLGVQGSINFTSGDKINSTSNGVDMNSSDEVNIKGTYIKLNG